MQPEVTYEKIGEVSCFDLRFKIDNILFVMSAADSINDIKIDCYEMSDCKNCPNVKNCEFAEDEGSLSCYKHEYMSYDEFDKYMKENYKDYLDKFATIINIWFNSPNFIIESIQEKIDKYGAE